MYQQGSAHFGRSFQQSLRVRTLRLSSSGLAAGTVIGIPALHGSAATRPASFVLGALIATPALAVAWTARRLSAVQTISRIVTATFLSYVAAWAAAVGTVVVVVLYQSEVLPAYATAATCAALFWKGQPPR